MRRLLAIALVLGFVVCGMTVARRLLVAGGGASFVIAPLPVWTRSGSNPIISAAAGWEGTSVQEATVLNDGTFRMWYRGGWGAPQAIGYATSADGISWTKYVSNPVYGDGGSGEAASVALPFVVKVASTYYLYSVKSPFLGANLDTLVVATSSDGIAWTTQTSSISRAASQDMWGNSRVWIEGGTWYLYSEQQRVTATQSAWQVWLYTSSDGLTWSIANSGGPVSGLRRAVNASYSVPQMVAGQEQVGGLYRAWFHSAASAGVDPVAIYHSTSPDRINWTDVAPTPHLATAGGSEGTSIGDPHIVEATGTLYLYYDGGNPTTGPAYLFVATYPGTLAQFVSRE